MNIIKKPIVFVTIIVIASIALTGVLLVSGIFLMRPSRTEIVEPLFQGVTYNRHFTASPQPILWHVITVDLTAPGVKLFVTPGDNSGGMELLARTTSEFLEEFDLQVAINGGFFSPMYSNGPWDFSPRSGEPINVRGLGISDGTEYSPSNDYSPVLCINTQNQVQILLDTCPANTRQALAGNMILLEGGHPIDVNNLKPKDYTFFQSLHPRTVVALDKAGQKMWLIVVDGRQPAYSDGASLAEVLELAQKLGADIALNLDGGGSSTLIAQGNWWPRVLNASIHTRVPMRQRPVANHLGIYADVLK